jgi:hypothetical protein
MSSSTRTSSFRTARMGSQSSHATASRATTATANGTTSLSTSLHHHPQPPHNSSKTSSQTPPLSLSFYNNSNNSVIHGDDATKKKKNSLNPTAVRERSKSIPGCKEIGVADNTTLIFLVVAPKSSDGKQNQPARITIFCDSGTIGTAKLLDGTVRQTFRRNVNSLDVVERLLTFPEGPVEINEHLIGIQDEENNTNENKDPSIIKIINYQKEVELADVGLCILEGEREKLTKHLRQLDEMKEEEEEQQQQQLSKNHKKQQQQQQQAPSSVASGRLQSQLLEQALNKSSTGSPNKSVSDNNNSNSNSNSNSNRTGRRRNKLLNLSSRQKRNNNNASDHNSNSKSATSAVVISKTNDPRTTITTIPTGTPPTKKKSNKSKNNSNTTNKLEENVLSAYASALITIAKPNNDGIDEDNDDDNASTSSLSSTGSHHQKQKPSSGGDVNEVAAYEFHFKLPADVMKQVDQCLRDIAKMNKVVKGVSTNGRGTVFLYGNGGVAYTPSIPKALYHKLRKLRSSSYSSRPCFVALGTRDRYYVAFNDGTADWKGSNVLDKMLKKILLKNNSNNSENEKKKNTDASKTNNSALSSMLPRSVGFGSTYDTFFIIFHDGSWQYQGRGIPKSLEDKLVERKNRADLLYCNLGPNGEWFLKAENGKMWWSGITHELDLVLKKIMSTGYLHNMDFGENGSYFISYDEE